MRSSYIIFLHLLLLINSNPAQTGNPDSTGGSFFSKIATRKNLTLAAVTGAFLLSSTDCYYMWWKGQGQSFAFAKHNRYNSWLDDRTTRGIDKVGHFYTSYLYYRVQKDILEWGGFTPSQSKWIAAGLTEGFAVLVEIGDGLTYYAFDYQDLVFNTAGLAFGLLQDSYPFFRNFRFKWSFFPSGENIKWPPVFSDHYYAHIYWLSFDLHNLLGKDLGRYWPSWINPAAGFSVSKDRKREFTAAFDLNLTAIFSTEKNSASDVIKNTINMFHFPLPGIKINEKSPPEYKFLIFN